MISLRVRVATAFTVLACGACSDSNATFEVRESIGQLQVTHALPGETLVVYDRKGTEVARGLVDELGSHLFRGIAPGQKYRVETQDGREVERRLRVYGVEESAPEPSFYQNQVLEPGYGYLTTRDGTQLSVYVQLPGPVDQGPYPTLVNYSGYSPSKPGESLGLGLDALCDDYPVLCDAPDHPSGLIGGMMGYATVGVNMRGTGCSGGAYDYFERLQLLDGYDVIEIISSQDWVLHNQVGMAGLSYPGITQLFVASQRPPGLAAITPLSVIGNTFSTLMPGGLLNDGFALIWIDRVLDRAGPYAQGWEQARVDAGDTLCEENQLLHGQKVDALQKIFDNPFYRADLGDPINPSVFAQEIEVPVFLAGAWQDEQTGPGFHALLDRFTSAPTVRINAYNGVHPDGYTPQILAEWKNFLDFYVKREIPLLDPTIRNLAPLLFSELFDAPLEFPDDRFTSFTSYESALESYEGERPLRILFENGGAPNEDPGAPASAFELRFDAWPVAAASARRWYLQADGTLGDDPPTQPSGGSRFEADPSEGQRGILAAGGRIWDKLPDYAWTDPGAVNSVAFVSEVLTEDLVMVGTGSVDLWVRSTHTEADLEVNLSEVRPDGEEMYVQSGWLKVSQRKIDPIVATALWPKHTHLREDAQPLTPGEWTEARILIEGFGHVFRTGSQIRLTIDTPGGSRAEWRFRLADLPVGTQIDIGHSSARPSSVLLPVVAGVTAPSALPACPSLRGQPCRLYAPFTNGAAP